MGSLERGAVGDTEMRLANVAATVMSARPDMVGVVHAAAARTDGSVRPTYRLKMSPARIIIGEMLKKCQQRHDLEFNSADYESK